MAMRKLPERLHAAWDWTNAAGELDELAAKSEDEAAAYARDSAENARAHDTNILEADIEELAAWLKENAVNEARKQ